MPTANDIIQLGIGLYLSRHTSKPPASVFDKTLGPTMLAQNRKIREENDSIAKAEIQQRSDNMIRSIAWSNRPLAVKDAMMANITREKHFLFAKIDRESAISNWYQDMNVLQTTQSVVNDMNAQLFNMQESYKNSVNRNTGTILSILGGFANKYLWDQKSSIKVA